MRAYSLPHRCLVVLLAWTLVWAPLSVWAGWNHAHADHPAARTTAPLHHDHCGGSDPPSESAPEAACPCPADGCHCLMAMPSAVPADPPMLLRARWARLDPAPSPPTRASRRLQPLLRPPAA